MLDFVNDSNKKDSMQILSMHGKIDFNVANIKYKIKRCENCLEKERVKFMENVSACRFRQMSNAIYLLTICISCTD